MRAHILVILLGLFLGISALSISTPAYGVIDTYYESFNDRQEGSTIDGIDKWDVYQGLSSNAITQESTTAQGTGKSLEMIGAESSVGVTYDKGFEQISPTWIEFIVKPGIGAETPDIPEKTIAAVTFDSTGKIYAADGTAWKDTGKTFTSDGWYRVDLKVDFSSHLYDVYVTSLQNADAAFSPAKENLAFIDPTINSLSHLKFKGVYNASGSEDNCYLDDIIVHFIDKLEFSTAPQNMTKSQPSGPITVQLQNSLGQPQTVWKDLTVELHSTSSGGEFSMDKLAWSPVTQLTIPENAQSATFYYKDTKSGSPIITINEYPDRGWTDAMQQQVIVSEIANFDITIESPQVAGNYFDLIITAKDDSGNINESYGDEIEIATNYVSPEGGSKKITPATASGFVNGVLQVKAMYPDCGIIQIAVSDKDDLTKAGSSGPITFIPDSLGLFCEGPQVVGSDFTLSITGYTSLTDEKGNKIAAPNYQGPVLIEASPVSPADNLGGSIVPSSVSGTDFKDGAADISAVYDRWGTIKIKAYDKNYNARTATSGDILFRPYGLVVDVIEPSETRDFFYIGENIEVLVKVADKNKEPIVNYLGKVTVGSDIALSIQQEYSFEAIDEGRHSFVFSADVAGSYKAWAEEESGLTAESSTIVVKKVYLQVVDTEAPLGTTEVEIRLVDENNNIITTESSLGVTVNLEEENANSSAVSSAVLKHVSFKQGIAKILVSDAEIETVTVIPKSKYKFDVRKGTVKFGEVSKKGVGVLMWREIKE